MDGKMPELPQEESGTHFLSLPGEIHSQIASYLTPQELLPFLFLHPTLLALTKSHLSPLPALIREILDRGSPYPPILAKLPSLTLLQPGDDDGTLFLDVLVRARPRWILERLELGRWTEKVWKEAYERRFLPSWKRYKGVDDTWRAVFLRILGRLEHRNLGCTHDESWTRFITLHRNGSASINRIYSRQFDPYQIYDELKHQNNFASQPTTVRVVVHLQDVRVIALGVLYRYPSFSTNSNAHDLLHPPLLTELSIEKEEVERPALKERSGSGRRHTVGSVEASTPLVNTAEGYFPNVTANSQAIPSTSQQSVPTLSPSTNTPSTRRATFSSLLSAKARRPSSQQVPAYPSPEGPSWSQPSQSSKNRLGSMLTKTRSRDSDDTTQVSAAGSSKGKRWGIGRRNSGEGNEKTGGSGPIIPASALFGESSGSRSTNGGMNGSTTHLDESQGRVISAAALFTDYTSISAGTPGPSILARPTTLDVQPNRSSIEEVISHTNAAPEVDQTLADVQQTHEVGPAAFIPNPPPPPAAKRIQLPYPLMRHPQPAPSHRLYPNYTPKPPPSPASITSNTPAESELFDKRQTHSVIEDDYAGNLWAHRRNDPASDGERGVDGVEGEEEDGEVDNWASMGERYVEWDDEEGYRKRWVGPMIVIAQLHPNYHPRAQPPGVDPTSETEGPDPDLGPKGMYVSLGFEDLEQIMGWVELKGGGAYVADPRKGGMGFD